MYYENASCIFQRCCVNGQYEAEWKDKEDEEAKVTENFSFLKCKDHRNSSQVFKVYNYDSHFVFNYFVFSEAIEILLEYWWKRKRKQYVKTNYNINWENCENFPIFDFDHSFNHGLVANVTVHRPFHILAKLKANNYLSAKATFLWLLGAYFFFSFFFL